MAWTPTEGMRRTEKLMLELKDAAQACGVETGTALYPMYHARVFDLISKALDEALADRSGREWVDKFEGTQNGNGQHGTNGGMNIAQLHPQWRNEQSSTPATADPIGFDPVIEAHEEGPGAPAFAMPLPYKDEPAPKKRGRPKGSKAKKAKVAKAKAAKPEVVVDNTGAADFAVATADPASEPTIDLVQ